MEEAALGYERALALNDRNPETYDALIRLHSARDSLVDRWRIHARKKAGHPLLRAVLDRANARFD